MPLIVGRNVPAWTDTLQNHHFQALTTTARTLQSDAPIIDRVILSYRPERSTAVHSEADVIGSAIKP